MSVVNRDNQKLDMDMEELFGLSSLIHKLNSYSEEDKNHLIDSIIITILFNTQPNTRKVMAKLMGYCMHILETKKE